MVSKVITVKKTHRRKRFQKEETVMKKRKCMALLMACLIAAGSLAGCGGKNETGNTGGSGAGSGTAAQAETGGEVTGENLPVDENGKPAPFGKYEEPVTVEIIQSINPTLPISEGESTTDNYYTRYVKENMNIDIKVKWQASNSDYAQKLNLAIASNDLPDILVVGEQEFRKLVKSDLLEDLTPYYETFASDIIKENIAMTDGKSLERATVDGKLYGLSNVLVEADGYNIMWIRQDWLDELGMEAPTTVEELENVAKAFVDNKMGGENTIGILGPTINSRLYNDFIKSCNNMNNLDGIFQAYKSWPGFWVEDESGKAVYGSTTAETREALGELQKMYAAGILDQELGVRKDADEAWKSGRAGILFSPWWHGYNVRDGIANNPATEWKAYPAPLAEDGQWYPKLSGIGDSYCVVRKGYEHPEVAFLLNNFLRRDEGKFASETTLDAGFYPGRVVITMLNENSFSVEVLRRYMDGEEVPEYDSVNYKLLDGDIASVDEILNKPYDDLGIENWNTEHTNFGRLYSLLLGSGAVVDAEEQGIVNKTYSLFYGQTETMEKKWANLKKKEDEVFLKIIIGEESIDAFDTFVEEWKAEGGDEITAEVQAQIQ